MLNEVRDVCYVDSDFKDGGRYLFNAESIVQVSRRLWINGEDSFASEVEAFRYLLLRNAPLAFLLHFLLKWPEGLELAGSSSFYFILLSADLMGLEEAESFGFEITTFSEALDYLAERTTVVDLPVLILNRVVPMANVSFKSTVLE